jgi:hypothetical protein
VSSGGEAGIDFANIGSPTTTVNLSGTTVKAVTDAVAVSDKTGFSLSAGGVTAVQSGLATQTSVDDIPTVAEFNARTLPSSDYFVVGDYTAPPTANAIADQVWDEAQADHLTAGSMGKWINDIALYGSAVFSAMEIDGFVYRFTANALELSPTGGSAPTAAAIADAVWDEVISGHLTSGSTGAALNAAGGSGDPWSTSLPGAYIAGQAGYILDYIQDQAALITSQSVFVTQDRVSGNTITMYWKESTAITVSLDEDVTAKTLRFVVEGPTGDLLVIEDANITTTTTSFTVTITTAITDYIGQYPYSLRDITGGINRVVSSGVVSVQASPNKDA